jgi:phosphatidate cytidylyltransferase
MYDLIKRVITGVIAGALFLGAYYYSQNLFSLLLIVIFCEIALFEWPRLVGKQKKLWLLLPIYPLFPFFCLLYLNIAYRSVDILLPLYPFFVCWIADTFAYLVGRGWGRHKIAPSISPKKTWEGLFGSVIGVFLLNWALSGNRAVFAFLGTSKSSVLFIASIFALVVFLGDLFESYLKRRAGLKDSGSILPGHGGFLDRFDSVFFVGILVLALCLKYL